MTDEELKERFDNLESGTEAILKTITDHQLLTIRMMAHQQAHLGVLRKLAKQAGESPEMLNQQMKSAYQIAVQNLHNEYESYLKSGDVEKLLNRSQSPENEQNN